RGHTLSQPPYLQCLSAGDVGQPRRQERCCHLRERREEGRALSRLRARHLPASALRRLTQWDGQQLRSERPVSRRAGVTRPDPQFLRVGDYWRAVGQPFNGRTLNANGKRPAWSSAFISFVLKEAGAGDRFKYSVAHCHYFQDFVERAGSALYEALPATEAIPK